MENEVLAPRKIQGANFTAVKFTGSQHVAHLKKHQKKYNESIVSFVEGRNINVDTDTVKRSTVKFAKGGAHLPIAHALRLLNKNQIIPASGNRNLKYRDC